MDFRSHNFKQMDRNNKEMQKRLILTWNKNVRWKLPTTFGKYTYYYLTFIVLVVIVVMITLQGWVLYRTQSNFIVISQT